MASNDSTSKPTLPKRGWFRYSLRTLLLVVTVLCVALGSLHQRARRQREAVAVLRKYSARICYRHQLVGKTSADSKLQPRWPRWLLDSLGEDYFVTVVWIEMGPTSKRVATHVDQMTDAECAALAQLDSLEVLIACSAPIEDRHLLAWRGLGNLHLLYLRDTKVTDRGLDAIPRYNKLETLHLERMNITDVSLPAIARLPNLTTLMLNRTQVTDEGLRSLSGARRLQKLWILQTAVTDAGLESLRGLPELKEVRTLGSLISPEAAREFEAATGAKVD